MHWHNSAEWAYVIDGHCQITVVDPEGAAEIANLGPGDLWYFPKGHGHAIQTLGAAPCHAILAFDDGLYSEHGTFGISDWMSRYDTEALSQAFGVSAEAFAQIPSEHSEPKQTGAKVAAATKVAAMPAGEPNNAELKQPQPKRKVAKARPAGRPVMLVAQQPHFGLFDTTW